MNSSDGPVYPHLHRPFGAVEPPFGPDMRDQLVLRQVLKPLRIAMAREVVGLRAQNAVVRGELARDEARILQVRDPNREIEAFADDVDQRVGENEVDRDRLVCSPGTG